MPWKEVKVMDERRSFIEAFLKKEFTFAELCRQYEISRKTGYKWVDRFEENGDFGLKDKSKAPHHQPRQISEDILDLILSTKAQWHHWGPKKILGHLQKYYSEEDLPCRTTIENVLRKNGLVQARKLRTRLAKRTEPLAHCHHANDVWCTDFKGWSFTLDNKKCGPYTLMDASSRFLISCVHLNENTTDHVWSILQKAFYEFGLPSKIRSDNGPPFASLAPGRLSRLSIKLIKAGVIPEWIEPGHPEQNGRQERMHLTLQNECISKDLTLSQQVREFDKFVEYYNFVRPHEALDQKCPGDIYMPSTKIWNGRLSSPEYPKGYKCAKVRSCGKFPFQGRNIYVSRVLEGEPIGICENEEGFTAYYGTIKLGVIGEENLEFERRPNRKR